MRFESKSFFLRFESLGSKREFENFFLYFIWKIERYLKRAHTHNIKMIIIIINYIRKVCPVKIIVSDVYQLYYFNFRTIFMQISLRSFPEQSIGDVRIFADILVTQLHFAEGNY